MKIWRLFITVPLLCSLGCALGLSGCGDNDDWRRITQEQAFDYFAENCGEDDVAAVIEALSKCYDDCLDGDRTCEEACFKNSYSRAITEGLWCYIMYLHICGPETNEAFCSALN